MVTDNLLGQNLGSYRIVEEIGKGGMATVYKAYQTSLNRYVAIKVLPPVHAKQPGFSERFQREARAIASLHHPNILPVYDSGQDGEYSFLVMRYVQEARTLKEVMTQPLNLSQIAELVGQIASALDLAHPQGIIHRDVKPSNVLVDPNGSYLLTDFGIAKMVENTAQFIMTGSFVGTPQYASPEQGLGQELDGRSDIYSLGVILYEMETGRQPFEGDTPMAVVVQHVHLELPLLGG